MFHSFFSKNKNSEQIIEQYNYKHESLTTIDSRSIMFTFRYIFNQGKKLKPRNIGVGIEKESENFRNNVRVL